MATHQSLPGIAIAEYLGMEFTDTAVADRFFRQYTIGNDTRTINQPFERFQHYEELMRGLRLLDANKYERMHKGTPFFFMAWLSFDMRNFEKALFYLDAAISEDVQATHDWQTLPGVEFLKLSLGNIAARTVVELRNALGVQINRFNTVSGRPPLTLESWTQHVVEPLLASPERRTILCSLYVFLYERISRPHPGASHSGGARGFQPSIPFPSFPWRTDLRIALEAVLRWVYFESLVRRPKSGFRHPASNANGDR